MYARTTQLEIDTMRTSVDDALEMFNQAVLPELQAQPGFEGLYVFTTADGKAMLVSFWGTAEEADASAERGWYSDVLNRYMTLFRAPPGRDHYEVRVAIPPAVLSST